MSSVLMLGRGRQHPQARVPLGLAVLKKEPRVGCKILDSDHLGFGVVSCVRAAPRGVCQVQVHDRHGMFLRTGPEKNSAPVGATPFYEEPAPQSGRGALCAALEQATLASHPSAMDRRSTAQALALVHYLGVALSHSQYPQDSKSDRKPGRGLLLLLIEPLLYGPDEAKAGQTHNLPQASFPKCHCHVAPGSLPIPGLGQECQPHFPPAIPWDSGSSYTFVSTTEYEENNFYRRQERIHAYAHTHVDNDVYTQG